MSAESGFFNPRLSHDPIRALPEVGRTPSFRSMPAPSSVIVRLICENWPQDGFAGFDGRQDIQVELSTRHGPEAGTPHGTSAVAWTTEMILKPLPDGSVDFAGSAVEGKRGERFFYLSWSSRTFHGRERFRRTKIQLRELTVDQLKRLQSNGGTITARISALARDRGPACATVPLLGGGWLVE